MKRELKIKLQELNLKMVEWETYERTQKAQQTDRRVNVILPDVREAQARIKAGTATDADHAVRTPSYNVEIANISADLGRLCQDKETSAKWSLISKQTRSALGKFHRTLVVVSEALALTEENER